ncbi:hypothetical protein B296_00049961 [Ensete ventricosum]|uniref:Uncharacterized protein n=1 Tax=Ensete ventricosum TaxID=4639 RepID=A0A426X1B2_ENSVE|nr:hypothetical protein B296_00049961 [Ensete ventricosum]
MELQLDDGPRSNLSIGPGFRRCSGISLKFTKRFVEGIGKLARQVGRSSEKDRKTCCKNIGGYQSGRRFDLHRKKIGSGRRCASRRRTWE